MGIPVGSKTVNLELRYSAINVTKDLNTGEITVTIPYQIGFFDENNHWITEKADYIAATKDAALILFGVTPAMLNSDTSTPVGELINKLAYAIVSGQIEVVARILVASTASTDANTPAPTNLVATVKKGTDILATIPVIVGTVSAGIPALLGATIEFSADGFNPVSVSTPVLQGTYEVSSLTFSPTQVQDADTGGDQSVGDDQNDPGPDPNDTDDPDAGSS